jgi:flagellar biosynthesis protein FliP
MFIREIIIMIVVSWLYTWIMLELQMSAMGDQKTPSSPLFV